MFRRLIIAVVSLLMLVPVAAAETIGGADMPEMLKAGDQELLLNGAGLRKKFFIKVYAGGLYLQQPGQSDPQKIIMADEPMAIRMCWLRDVPGDKIVNGWNTGFANSLDGNTGPLQEKIERFNAVFKDGCQENEIDEIVYTPESGVAVYKNGMMVQQIEGKDFKEALFGIWLGEKTEVADLKSQMLGE